MGLNIYKGIIEDFNFVYDDNWDSSRHSGDKEFVSDLKWIWARYDKWGRFLDQPGRPSDIDEAILWVKSNVYPGNQQRLLDLLEEMKIDDTIWIYISY